MRKNVVYAEETEGASERGTESGAKKNKIASGQGTTRERDESFKRLNEDGPTFPFCGSFCRLFFR